MQEGQTYFCKWCHTKDQGYEAWIVKWPHVRAIAATAEELQEKLQDAIGEAWGDGEPQMEFEPPLVKTEKWEHLFVDGLMCIRGSHYRFADTTELFSGGFCEYCRCGKGDRKPTPITVESMWPCELAWSWDPKAEGAHLLLASEKLLVVLSSTSDRQEFDLLPVKMPPRTRKRFFEIRPKRFFPEVSAKGLHPTGWRCHLCDRQCFSDCQQLGVSPVICRSDLPTSLPSIFFVGGPTTYELCLDRSAWSKHKANLRELKITSDRVAVIEEDDCVRRPMLGPYPSEAARRPKE